MATLLCSVFWALYGVEVSDPFLLWPNVIGTGLGAVQVATIVRFWDSPPKPTSSVEDPEEEEETLIGCEAEEAEVAIEMQEHDLAKKPLGGADSEDGVLHEHDVSSTRLTSHRRGHTQSR